MAIQFYDPGGKIAAAARAQALNGRPTAAKPKPQEPTQHGDAYEYGLRMAAKAPVREQAPAPAQQQPASGGILGRGLGMVLNNPIARTITRPLDVLDVPRRTIWSGINEVVDQLNPNDNQGGFSLQDFYDQANPLHVITQKGDVTFGAGDVIPEVDTGLSEGWDKWINRGIGLAGDVALDPLTYVGGLGFVPEVGTISSRLGRMTRIEEGFAALDKVGQLTDDIIESGKRVANTGNWGHADPLLREAAKVSDTAGVHMAIPFTKARTGALPGTRAAGNKLADVIGGVKGAINQSDWGARRISENVTEELNDVMPRLLSGTSSNEQFRKALGGVAIANERRAAKTKVFNVLERDLNKTTRQVKEYLRQGNTVEDLIRHTEDLTSAPTPLNELSDRVIQVAADMGVELPPIKDIGYFPHVLNKELKDLLRNGGDDAERFMQQTGIVSKELFGDSGFLQGRKLRGSPERPLTITLPNGRTATFTEGTVAEINEKMAYLFPQLKGTALETDPRTALERYVSGISEDIGNRAAEAKLTSTGATPYIENIGTARTLPEPLAPPRQLPPPGQTLQPLPTLDPLLGPVAPANAPQTVARGVDPFAEDRFYRGVKDEKMTEVANAQEAAAINRQLAPQREAQEAQRQVVAGEISDTGRLVQGGLEQGKVNVEEALQQQVAPLNERLGDMGTTRADLDIADELAEQRLDELDPEIADLRTRQREETATIRANEREIRRINMQAVADLEPLKQELKSINSRIAAYRGAANRKIRKGQAAWRAETEADIAAARAELGELQVKANALRTWGTEGQDRLNYKIADEAISNLNNEIKAAQAELDFVSERARGLNQVRYERPPQAEIDAARRRLNANDPVIRQYEEAEDVLRRSAAAQPAPVAEVPAAVPEAAVAEAVPEAAAAGGEADIVAEARAALAEARAAEAAPNDASLPAAAPEAAAAAPTPPAAAVAPTAGRSLTDNQLRDLGQFADGEVHGLPVKQAGSLERRGLIERVPGKGQGAGNTPVWRATEDGKALAKRVEYDGATRKYRLGEAAAPDPAAGKRIQFGSKEYDVVGETDTHWRVKSGSKTMQVPKNKSFEIKELTEAEARALPAGEAIPPPAAAAAAAPPLDFTTTAPGHWKATVADGEVKLDKVKLETGDEWHVTFPGEEPIVVNTLDEAKQAAAEAAQGRTPAAAAEVVPTPAAAVPETVVPEEVGAARTVEPEAPKVAAPAPVRTKAERDAYNSGYRAGKAGHPEAEALATEHGLPEEWFYGFNDASAGKERGAYYEAQKQGQKPQAALAEQRAAAPAATAAPADEFIGPQRPPPTPEEVTAAQEFLAGEVGQKVKADRELIDSLTEIDKKVGRAVAQDPDVRAAQRVRDNADLATKRKPALGQTVGRQRDRLTGLQTGGISVTREEIERLFPERVFNDQTIREVSFTEYLQRLRRSYGTENTAMRRGQLVDNVRMQQQQIDRANQGLEAMFRDTGAKRIERNYEAEYMWKKYPEEMRKQQVQEQIVTIPAVAQVQMETFDAINTNLRQDYKVTLFNKERRQAERANVQAGLEGREAQRTDMGSVEDALQKQIDFETGKAQRATEHIESVEAIPGKRGVTPDQKIGPKQTYAPTKKDLKGFDLHTDPAYVQPLNQTLKDIEMMAALDPNMTSQTMGSIESLLHQHKQKLRGLTGEDLSIRQTEGLLREANSGRLLDVVAGQLRDTWTMLPGRGDMVIDAELNRWLTNIMKARKEPGTFGRVLTAFTNFFKTYATLTPGFHIRNAMSAVFMNTVDGVPLRTQWEGLKLWQQWEKADDPLKWLNSQTPEIQKAFDATFASGAGGRFLESGVAASTATNRTRFKEGIYRNRVTTLSQKGGRRVEGSVRLGMALDETRKGASVASAYDRIARIHFDYAAVSRMDEQAKKLVPFWTFTSRNLPMQISEMWKKPRVYAWYNSFVRNFEVDPAEFTPEYFESIGAWNTGETVAGMPLYMQPDLPHLRLSEDLDRYTKALQGENIGQVVSDLNPFFTAPAEYITGTDMYTGRQFKDTDYTKAEGFVDQAMLPIMKLLNQTKQGADGTYVQDRGMNFMRAVNPLMDRTVRLLPGSSGSSGDPDRQLEAIARTMFAAPFRTLSPAQQESTQRSQYFDKLDEKAMQRVLAGGGG